VLAAFIIGPVFFKERYFDCYIKAILNTTIQEEVTEGEVMCYGILKMEELEDSFWR
jgi:hypothetical protein